MPHKDPEVRREYRRAYHAEYDPRYYEINAEEIRQKKRDAVRARTQRLRLECVKAYGSVCACCGLDEIVFLTFDHVNNDGAAHRLELFGTNDTGRPRGGTYTFMRWLRDNGYPDMIQLLCANCQLGKVRNGGVCPHQDGKEGSNGRGPAESAAG